VDFVRQLRRDDWQIVAGTARPADLKRVWRDSYGWLRARDIAPDQLWLIDTDRALLAHRLVQTGYDVVAMEDDPTLALRLADVCPVLMRSHPNNAGVQHPAIRRRESFADSDAIITAGL
jgi:hypothetical protein